MKLAVKLGFVTGLACGPVSAAPVPVDAPDQKLPPSVSAVQKYILDKDYPEVFAGQHYKTKIQNVVVADLDGDGQAEVIVHYMPHYRQSPTIVIYRVTAEMAVTRVREGLAPGPLQPLSGDYLDGHTVGEAIDLSLGDKQADAKVRRGFSVSTLEKGMSVVEYANFLHMDGRSGQPVFIDMTGLAIPPKSDKCEDFEFSPVRGISAGTVLAVGGENLLAAWAQNKIYLYRIKFFPMSGLLDKEMWAVDAPRDFQGFAPGAEGPLKYVTPSGAQKPLSLRCNSHTCTPLP